MSSRFLLPCECGQSTPIEVSQAGQTVVCSCGRSLQAPTLRGMRQLQPAAEDSSARRPAASTWNATQGAVFALGALLAIGGVITAAYNFRLYSQASQIQPSQEVYAAELEGIEQASPFDLLVFWDSIRTHGLGESSPYARVREDARRYRSLSLIGGGAGLAGVVIAALSMLMPGRRPAARRVQ